MFCRGGLDNPVAMDVLEHIMPTNIDYETGESNDPSWTRVKNRRAEEMIAQEAEEYGACKGILR